MKRLSILMPAFNEGQHIFDNVLQTCSLWNSDDIEVIIIDDGSLDNTYSEALASTKIDERIRVMRMEKNSGKGAALVRGFSCAQGNFVAFLDSDLEIKPVYVAEMLSVIEAGRTDVVVGRKIYKHTNIPMLRRIMSWFYRFLVKLLFNMKLSDTQTGIKVFRREVLENCMPKMAVKGFAFDVELLALAQKADYWIEEYPVEVTFKRTRSLERIKAIHIVRMFIDTFKIFFRLQRIKV